jgi:hypothetical protein
VDDLWIAVSDPQALSFSSAIRSSDSNTLSPLYDGQSGMELTLIGTGASVRIVFGAAADRRPRVNPRKSPPRIEGCRDHAPMDDTALPDGAVPLPRDSALSPLHQRTAGHCVIAELLSVQQAARPRSALSRVLGISPLLKDARPWYWGALGEIAVGRLLTKLPEGWHVLHAVPVGKGSSDIDHVVIGPGGVFTINTKNHSGQKVWVAGRTLMVAGQKQPHIRNAEHEAERAGRLLSAAADAQIEVTPVVAVVEPQSLTVRGKPAKVVVLTSAQLVRWLKKRPQLFTADQVAWLLRPADAPATWHVAPAEAQPASALQAAFSALEKEVRGARSVRRVWGFGLAGGGAIAALTVGPKLLQALLSALVA